MKRDFFTKAVGYQRRNVLNIISNTMIVIYKGCDILCFSNDTMYSFFHFYCCNLTLVGPYCSVLNTGKCINTSI